jgi:6-pyruvoyltetrahydropterin/6-carboxytetrahydropterin synthase
MTTASIETNTSPLSIAACQPRVMATKRLCELSQRFYFEAAHTLHRTIDTAGSLQIHGHTYEAEVTITGETNPESGMVLDLAYLRKEIARVRELLDHRFLDEIQELGPATLENLCEYIRRQLEQVPGLSSVLVERRASGDRCVLRCANVN